MRFEQEGGKDLVGNFQCGNRDYSAAITWDEAGVVICVAQGFLYLVPYASPEAYKAYQGAFGAVALCPSGMTLYAVDEARVLAFGPDLNIRWDHQEDLWRCGSDVILDRVEHGSILVSAQFDLEGPWTEYLLSEQDGALLRIGTA